jgi:hypothetical protein
MARSPSVPDGASTAAGAAREADGFPLAMPTVHVPGARRDWRAEEAARRAGRAERRTERRAERGYVVVEVVEGEE